MRGRSCLILCCTFLACMQKGGLYGALLEPTTYLTSPKIEGVVIDSSPSLARALSRCFALLLPILPGLSQQMYPATVRCSKHL